MRLLIILALSLFLKAADKTPFDGGAAVAGGAAGEKKEEVVNEVYKPDTPSFNNDEDDDHSMQYLDAIQNSFFVKSRKDTDNSLNINYKRGYAYKIRLRYAMATAFIFENDVIERYINGDPVGFSIEEIKDENDDITSLIIKPNKIGIDSNLIVFGKSGQIYTFYIFATHITNRKNPVFTVYIKNLQIDIKKRKELEALRAKNAMLKGSTETKRATKKTKQTKQEKEKAQAEEKMKIDYKAYEKDTGKFLVIGDDVNRLNIDKSKIKEDFYQEPKSYRTWWSLWLYKKTSNASKKIMAKRIFRDKDYTYFKYDRADNQNKFPVIFKVVDGYDNPVNTKVVGDYIIAEDVSDKFTLKMGDEWVCVERIP